MGIHPRLRQVVGEYAMDLLRIFQDGKDINKTEHLNLESRVAHGPVHQPLAPGFGRHPALAMLRSGIKQLVADGLDPAFRGMGRDRAVTCLPAALCRENAHVEPPAPRGARS